LLKFSNAKGFTLLELITVMVLLGIVSVTLFTRIGPVNTVAVQSGRDDLIAALFFAQQQAMMRPNITLVINADRISVNENNISIKVASDHYPLVMPKGVSLSPSPITLIYDKLGRTTATDITLTGSGSSSGVSASVRVEASGYAFAN
jgi:MSHA pilin protein MshC